MSKPEPADATLVSLRRLLDAPPSRTCSAGCPSPGDALTGQVGSADLRSAGIARCPNMGQAQSEKWWFRVVLRVALHPHFPPANQVNSGLQLALVETPSAGSIPGAPIPRPTSERARAEHPYWSRCPTRRSVVVPVARRTAPRDTDRIKERRHPMTSVFMIASALEVGLVIVASAIFLAMVIAGLALIVWFVAGFVRATHA